VAFFGGIGSVWIVLTLAGAVLGGLGAKRLADDLLTRRTRPPARSTTSRSQP
jgi:hypothetical protein